MSELLREPLRHSLRWACPLPSSDRAWRIRGRRTIRSQKSCTRINPLFQSPVSSGCGRFLLSTEVIHSVENLHRCDYLGSRVKVFKDRARWKKPKIPVSREIFHPDEGNRKTCAGVPRRVWCLLSTPVDNSVNNIHLKWGKRKLSVGKPIEKPRE